MKDKEEVPNSDLKKSVWQDREKIVDGFFDVEVWQDYQADTSEDIPTDRIYHAIQQEIVKDTIYKFDKRERKYKIYRLIKYSAVACLILLISWKFWQYQLNQHTHPARVLSDVSTVAPEEEIWITETNTENKVKWITLPDSSRAKLYPSSQVRFAQHFHPTHRDIYLVGKAYFKVTEDSSRPFSVWSEDTRTTALGTSFTVNAYQPGRKTTVTLHTGKIVIRSAKANAVFEEVYLSKQGEKLVFNNETQRARRIVPSIRNEDKAGQEVMTDHTRSVVKMEKMPLPDAINLLGTLYKASIIIEDKSIQHITFTGTVDARTEKLEDALQTICLINNLQWRRSEDGTYYIVKNEKPEQENND